MHPKIGQTQSQIRRRHRPQDNLDRISDSRTPVQRTATSTYYLLALTMIFGGCCSNVCTFECLLRVSPALGSTITFGQMLFITLQSLPSFLSWNKESPYPRLLPRQVPLREWLLQVIVLVSGNLLNNWAFAYHVPLALQIIFRSSGLPVSMLMGYLAMKRTYAPMQIASVIIVSFGVLLSTLSATPSSSTSGNPVDSRIYLTGIVMLTISLFLTGILGVLQEKTYKKYGPCWKEGVFYTHLLSLPTFAFLLKDIQAGLYLISISSTIVRAVFLANFVTQLACVSGVNLLASRVSSGGFQSHEIIALPLIVYTGPVVSTNLVLTVRKAVSLLISVYFWGSGWSFQLGTGAAMVFSGSIIYSMS